MTDQPVPTVSRDMPPPPPPDSSVSAVKKSSTEPEAYTMPSAPRMSRMPSLKQLTDRYANQALPAGSIPSLHITTDIAASASPSSSTRLRLPASALTRSLSSQGSVATPLTEKPNSSVPDGSVNLPDPISPRTSAFPSAIDEKKDSPAGSGYIKGYKSVPTLDEIRRRVGSISLSAGEAKEKIAAVSVDESNTVSEASLQTPPSSASSTSSKSKEHPLQHLWTMYFDSKSHKPAPPADGGSAHSWENNLVTVGTFDTVESFARHLNNVRSPSALAKHSNYHVFKDGIKPMWEDPANANGGKWVLVLRNGSPLLDTAWADILMSLVGEQLDPDDDIAGVVISTRPKIDRIQLWLKASDDVEKINGIAKRLLACLGLQGKEDEGVGLDFQYNSADARSPSKSFLSIPFNSNAAPRNNYSAVPARPAPMWRSASTGASSAFGGPLGGSRIPGKV